MKQGIHNMKPMLTNIAFFICLPLLLFTSICCNNNEAGKYNVDISDIKADIQIYRFEQDLFSSDPDSISSKFHRLEEQYPAFFPVYIEKILRLGPMDKKTLKQRPELLKKYQNQLKVYLANDYIQGLYDTTQVKYSDISSIEKELETAFKHFKYYFDSVYIPDVYTFISEFHYGSITTDTILGIGLDMYLGADYRYYPSVNIPDYLIRRLNRAFITPNSVKVWLQNLFPYQPEKKQLLSKMIYNGKILHCMDHVLPNTHDSLKIGYTRKQLNWCRENDSNIWAYFIEHDLLYMTNEVKYAKYVNEGPTTSGMPPTSPGNIGSWLGWQIVKKFMEEQPDVTLQQLMRDSSLTAQKILTLSKYKPEKLTL